MLRVVGAGLPRTATRSQKDALELLLGGRCYHMAEVFEHLEDVPTWRAAARGDEVDWSSFPRTASRRSTGLRRRSGASSQTRIPTP